MDPLSPDLAFRAGNLLALASWIALALSPPTRRWAPRVWPTRAERVSSLIAIAQSYDRRQEFAMPMSGFAVQCQPRKLAVWTRSASVSCAAVRSRAVLSLDDANRPVV